MATVNAFDQFDTPATVASSALANPFDQFDTTEEPPQFPETVLGPTRAEADDPSLGGSTLRAVPRGAVETAATALEPFALSRRRAQTQLGAMTTGARGAGELGDENFQGFLLSVARDPNMPRSLMVEIINAAMDVRSGKLAAEAIPDFAARFEGNLPADAAEAMRAFAASAFPIPQEHEGRLPVQVGRGIGSTLTFLLSRLVPGGQVLLPVFAGSIGAGEAIERAAQAGADDETQARAGLMGVVPGLTDIIPIERLLKPIARIPGVKGALYAIARKAIEQGVIEGTQEAVQGFLQNAIQRITTVPERPLTEGIAQDGLVGFLVGTLFGGGAGGLSVATRPIPPEERPRPTAPVTPADEASPIPTELIAEGRAIVQEAEGGAIPEGAVPAEVLLGATPDAEAAISEAAALVDRAKDLTARQAEQAAALAEIEAGIAQLETPEAAAAPVELETVNPFDQFDEAAPTEGTAQAAPAAPEGPVVVRPGEGFGGVPIPPGPVEAETATTAAPSESQDTALVDRVRARHTELMQKVQPDFEAARSGGTADLIVSAAQTGQFNDAMRPLNKNARRVFEEITGVKLPKGVKATQDLFTGQPFHIIDQAQQPEPGGDEFGGALSAAQDFVRAKDGGRVTILSLQKRFELDHAQARRLHGKLRSDGDLTAKGYARAFRTTLRDVLAVIKGMGGVRPDSDLEALDLRIARPGLVVGRDKGGRSVSDIREHLEELQMLPPGSHDTEVYDLIRSALAKEPGRVTVLGDEDLGAAQQARDIEDDNAVALEDASDEVRAFAKSISEPYSAEKIRDLATQALESGRDVEDVVSDDAERTAIVAVESFSEEVQNDDYGDIPFLPAETGQTQDDRSVGPRQPGSEAEPRVEGQGAAVDADVGEDRGPPASQEVAADAALVRFLREGREQSVDTARQRSGKPLNRIQREAYLAGYHRRVAEIEGTDTGGVETRFQKGAAATAYRRGEEGVGFRVGQFRRREASATDTTEPTPDLTPPAEPPPGIPRIGRLVEEHGDIQIRVNPNGSFSVGSMRSGAWTSQNRFDKFEDARALAKEFAARAKPAEPTTEQTDQGEQIVVPGAERTTGKEFVEAQADRRIKGTKRQKPADEGLFDEDSRNQTELFSLGPVNPRFAGDVKRIGANLQARLKKLGIADKVALRVMEDLSAVVGGRRFQAEGRFTAPRTNDPLLLDTIGLIEVSLAAQDGQWVLDHEVIHALREYELIRDTEWTTLTKAAKADTERMGRMRDQRKGQGLTEEQIVEEVIADQFADWSVGRTQASGFLKRAFERIRDFLTAFGRSLTQRGYTSVNDIFESVESGEVGRRTADQTGPVPDNVTNSQERFSLQPNEARTTEGRKSAFGRLLSEGRPLDRAFRLPFDIFGGMTQAGEWKPGLGLYDKARAVITEAKFDPAGKFAWMNGTLEASRAGLIDRYGLSDEFVERERKRSRDERAIMLQGAEILKTLKDQNVGIEEAQILQAILTGEAVPDERWEAISVPIRQAIDQLGQEAVSLGLLSRESYERNRGAYLHRVYMKHEAEQDGLSRWAGRMMGRNRKKIIGDQFKGRGMFLDVEADKVLRDLPGFAEGRRGRLVKGEKIIILDVVDETGDLPGIADSRARPPSRRVFWPADQAVPDRLRELRDRGTWEVRSALGKKVTLWRDFTKPERVQMGEILDARYTIGKTFMSMAHDLATGRFYKDISENGEWSRSDIPNSVWVDASEYNRHWADDSVDWVRVPDTAIRQTGGKKRWGALAGKYVRSEIWRDLNELDVLQRPNVWQKLLTQWKLNKTARSPVVHMNNVMSNFVFMDLADIGARDFAAGLRAYIRQTADFQEAADNGAFGSDMISQEIKRDVLQPLLKELQTNLQGGVGAVQGRFGIVGKLADRLWSGVTIADRGMVDLYRIEDEVFRMATYMRRRELGDSPQAAASTAREQFLDYDIRAPWINTLRRSALPFLSYTYRAAPVIARSLAAHPWKIAKYFTIAYVANQLAYMMEPGDEDEERRLLREQEQGHTWIGTPRMQRMPWRDEHGNPVFLDVRRWIPAGDIFDMGQGSSAFPIPAPLLFGGPLMLAGELMLNRSAFTGQDITNERTDTGVEKAEKNAGYLWRSWMPSAAWVPGSWYWNKIGRAATGARDRTGRAYSLPQAVASSVGVKLKPQDVEQNFAQWAREFDRVERDLRFEARRLESDRERGIISQASFDRAWGRLLDKFENLATSKREVLDPRR